MIRFLYVALVFAPAVAGGLAEAGVTRFQIDRRDTVLSGKPFGAAGPDEKLSGIVHFALDPSLPQNQAIVDLARAAKRAGPGGVLRRFLPSEARRS